VVTGATVTAVNVQTGIGTFGFVSGSRPARILQIAAKVVF
jgi:hypothetical protein